MRLLSALLVIVLSAAMARADIIYLNDGTQVQGKLRKTPDGWAVMQANGKEVRVREEDVASIEATPSTPSPSEAAEGLESLRRVVDHMDDIPAIISRYQTFIARNSDAAVLADANKDLQLWQDRQSQGLVKVGNDWITPQERDRRRSDAQTEALKARDLMAQLRYKDADALLRQAVTDDPGNSTALYLQGILAILQNQPIVARKALEAANAAQPNYGPTLNNLAVLAWRQKVFIAAIGFYEQAMTAAPGDQNILDNVAEALHGLPDDSRQAPIVARISVLFTQQDTQLQKTQAQKGLYRWGSSWVTAQQLDVLKAQQAKVQQQIDQLTQKFDDLQQQVATLDSEIEQNNREIHLLQAQSIVYEPSGITVQMPLPQSYYDLQNDNQQLTAKRKALTDHQDALKAQAKQIQQSGPQPPFTGVQQIIGADAAPTGEPPATAPSSPQPDPNPN